VTGKGDRWGRDRLGRSEPAFLSASTIALPPSNLHCTARPANVIWQLLFFCKAGQLLAVVFLEACAGRRFRRLCPPAVACSAGCVPVARLCHAMPTALNVLAPVHFALFAPCHSMCARINSLQAARLSRWQLQHGPAVAARAPVLTFYLFHAESMILGHG